MRGEYEIRLRELERERIHAEQDKAQVKLIRQCIVSVLTPQTLPSHLHAGQPQLLSFSMRTVEAQGSFSAQRRGVVVLQVDRYKGLLVKQRDIMTGLTGRLNERDEQILRLQEELEAYDSHQK